MKRLLFDAGSIATVISPLLLAVFFMSQTSERVDSSSVVLATSELRPAMSAVTDAAREGAGDAENKALLDAVEELYGRLDHATTGLAMVLPERTAQPLIESLSGALDEFTGSQAASPGLPGEGDPTLQARTRANLVIADVLSIMSPLRSDHAIPFTYQGTAAGIREAGRDRDLQNGGNPPNPPTLGVIFREVGNTADRRVAAEGVVAAVMIVAVQPARKTGEHAQWLAAPGALSFVRMRSGRPGRFPTPEEAAAYEYSPHEQALLNARTSSQVIGGPETVRDALVALVESTQADELVITTAVHSHGDRVRSYELIAEAVGLQPAAAVA